MLNKAQAIRGLVSQKEKEKEKKKKTLLYILRGFRKLVTLSLQCLKYP